jgi:hypothetical protein
MLIDHDFCSLNRELSLKCMFLYCKCRKFESIVPRNETARPHSKFLHSCICERVMYMYIPTIAPQTQYSKIGGPIEGIYKSLTDAWMQKLGIRLHNFISGNICFEFSVQCKPKNLVFSPNKCSICHTVS